MATKKGSGARLTASLGSAAAGAALTKAQKLG